MPAPRKKKAKTSKRKASKAAPAQEASFVILLDEEPEESAKVVKLRRDCKIEEIDGIRQRLLTALGENAELVVDLGNVRDVDCAFLQVLVSLRLEAKAQEKTVSVRSGSDSLLASAGLLGLADQIA